MRNSNAPQLPSQPGVDEQKRAKMSEKYRRFRIPTKLARVYKYINVRKRRRTHGACLKRTDEYYSFDIVDDIFNCSPDGGSVHEATMTEGRDEKIA